MRMTGRRRLNVSEAVRAAVLGGLDSRIASQWTFAPELLSQVRHGMERTMRCLNGFRPQFLRNTLIRPDRVPRSAGMGHRDARRVTSFRNVSE